jgi:protein involved in polysaccharide export with SLBB domain
MPRLAVLPLAVLCAAVLPAPAAAQFFARADSQAHRMLATRATLTALAQTLDSILAAPTTTGADQGRARALGYEVHARLDAGDFRAGDRIAIRVVGEVGLPDTLEVSPDEEVELPTIGTIPLHGVLRADLETQLAQAVGRVIRDPEVHAHGLVQLSVQGEVTHPGYCNVRADSPLSAVLTAVGGYTKDAKVKDLRVERSGVPLIQGAALRRLMEEGRTVDDAGLRPGDQFVVPGHGQRDPYDAFRLAAAILSIPLTVYTLLKVF